MSILAAFVLAALAVLACHVAYRRGHYQGQAAMLGRLKPLMDQQRASSEELHRAIDAYVASVNTMLEPYRSKDERTRPH